MTYNTHATFLRCPFVSSCTFNVQMHQDVHQHVVAFYDLLMLMTEMIASLWKQIQSELSCCATCAVRGHVLQVDWYT